MVQATPIHVAVESTRGFAEIGVRFANSADHRAAFCEVAAVYEPVIVKTIGVA